MIYRTQKEKIDAYFDNDDAISQSQLKLFLGGIDKYLAEKDAAKKNEYYDEPADHFIIGSAVDSKLTEGDEVFKERYHISNLDKKPTDKIISILKHAFDVATEGLTEVNPTTVNNVTFYTNEVIAACEYENYYPKWGVDAKLNALAREGAADYWNELIISSGKQILTLENMMLINRVVDSFKFNPEMAFYFNDALHIADDAPKVDVFFQVPIMSQINRIPVKALLDIVIVNHDMQRIIVVDIKTMGDTIINFASQTRKRRYDIQISFYHDLVKALKERHSFANYFVENYGVDGERFAHVNSYDLALPEFYVQSTKYNNSAAVFTVHPTLLRMGREGRKNVRFPYIDKNEDNSKFLSMEAEDILGYLDLLNAYNYYREGFTSHQPRYVLQWLKID